MGMKEGGEHWTMICLLAAETGGVGWGKASMRMKFDSGD
jgi:hypothetical protein